MTRHRRRYERVLAVDPTSRGFGFVVFEGQERLVDWGVKEARRNKTEATLKKIRELIEFLRPHVLVVENCTAPGSRRGQRARQLIAEMTEVADTMNVRTRRVSVAMVRRAFSENGSGEPTKHQIASVIAERFPELTRQLPPPRKLWMSEPDRMAIFDALTLAVPPVVRLHGPSLGRGVT
jgi:hypothetical protein